MGKSDYLTLSQKHNLEKAAERFLAAAIERNAIRSAAVGAGVHVRRKEKNHSLIPFVSQMCAWHEKA